MANRWRCDVILNVLCVHFIKGSRPSPGTVTTYSHFDPGNEPCFSGRLEETGGPGGNLRGHVVEQLVKSLEGQV